MKASKWIHPTTGEVRVYLNGFKGDTKSIKAFAAADKDGDAVVTVEGGQSQKIVDTIKSDIRNHFGRQASFVSYLDACQKVAEKSVDKSYGSAYANAYEQHTGNAFGE